MEKIAIISIATGNYIKLFNNFKDKIIKNFLPGRHKDIFLFTDNLNIDHDNLIFTPHLPWPLCTLLRFHYINKQKEKLINFDCIYYIDVDMIAADLIDEEILPVNNEIICTQHYYHPDSYILFENSNQKSTAYVPHIEKFDYKYFQACFFGAKPFSFFTMSDILEENINIDLKNNIIAKWHDESHFNKYLISNSYKMLNIGYTHPQKISLTENKNKIKFIHKNANSDGID